MSPTSCQTAPPRNRLIFQNFLPLKKSFYDWTYPAVRRGSQFRDAHDSASTGRRKGYICG